MRNGVDIMKKSRKISIGLKLAAITGLAALVFSACGVEGKDDFFSDLSEVTDEMSDGFSKAKDNIEKLVPQVKEEVKNNISEVKDLLKEELPGVIDEMENGFSQAEENIKEIISEQK